MLAMSSRPPCSSRTSRSLRGRSSRRPYPPTATRATSASAPSSSASHRSTCVVRRARSAANDVMESTCPPVGCVLPRRASEPPLAAVFPRRSFVAPGAGLGGKAQSRQRHGPAARSWKPPVSDSVRATLAGADSDDRLNRDRPDLAVADPAGLGRLDHDSDEVVGVLVLAQDLDADLRYQVDLVLGAAVDLRVPALPAVPARLGDRQAVDAERLQRGLDVVQLERLDDSGDELHLVSLRLSCTDLQVPTFHRRRRRVSAA